MKYKRFEDLPVWKTAADVAAEILDWCAHPLFRGKGDLANQLQRAALSISNNIAEGFERGTTEELIKFLSYALGSAGEVRSMLLVMRRTTRLCDLGREIDILQPQVESISRQLRGWSDHLQNTDIRGVRHLNDQTRREYADRQRKDEWRTRQREFVAAKEAEIMRTVHERQQLEAETQAVQDDDSDPSS